MDAIFLFIVGLLFTCTGINAVRGAEKQRQRYQDSVSQRYMERFLRRLGIGKIVLSVPAMLCGPLLLLIPWWGWKWIFAALIVLQTAYSALLHWRYTRKA